MSTIATDRMIARRVKRGANENESRALLAECVAACTPANLPSALLYNEFISKAQAESDAYDWGSAAMLEP